MSFLKCAKWFAILLVLGVVLLSSTCDAKSFKSSRSLTSKGITRVYKMGERSRRNIQFMLPKKKCPPRKKRLCTLFRILVQCQRIYCQAESCSVYNRNSRNRRKCNFCRRNVCSAQDVTMHFA